MQDETPPRPAEGASKQRILRAAIREFETYGYAGARVDRIAEAAEANKQLVYRHFGSKEKLYDAVFSHLTAQLRDFGTRASKAGVPYTDWFVPAEGEEPDENMAQTTWTRLLTWEGLAPSTRDTGLLTMLRENYAIQARELRSDPRAQAALTRFPAHLLVALVIAADHLPFATPSVFAALLDKEAATHQDVVDWFEFVKELLSAVGPAPDVAEPPPSPRRHERAKFGSVTSSVT
ncbi:hypothetical protein GCM10025867_36840 [Frondihabitans sucicola]|uniref:HTH tetR-type domain-containing protein n=1 Tax=Frondihabitans sucicola TaxID=1268041 RepID=A0ABN6Y7B6_9MICO|nr:TetR/AcrR family transcriptional regulator [Frondihabitans sucicola]BDZ51443.1 hypothetical protein GCM10025867_36840 [Frondihabitans sucicola]